MRKLIGHGDWIWNWGFHWSMVDMVNSGSHGYELGETLRVSSTNMAQIEAVAGGWNEVTVSLGMRGAGNKDTTATISKQS